MRVISSDFRLFQVAAQAYIGSGSNERKAPSIPPFGNKTSGMRVHCQKIPVSIFFKITSDEIRSSSKAKHLTMNVM